MRKLVREVRFSVNPFLAQDKKGFNSFASNPPGEGLSLFFSLWVELTGKVEPSTGFVVNVTDIDKAVRSDVAPIFGSRIREYFKKQQHISTGQLRELVRLSWEKLADKFKPAELNKLSLGLNPFRKIEVDSEDCQVVYFSEKFEFAAMHKLWNDAFSEEKNFEVFGKCAHPSGHGHNYVIEVTVKVPVSDEDFHVGEYERIVDERFVRLVDHKNLNVDVPELATAIPTVENIAAFAWSRLAEAFDKTMLHCVTVWETSKTYCSYYG